jgi:hypothetical protein
MTTLEFRHTLDDELNVVRMPVAPVPQGCRRIATSVDRFKNEVLHEILDPIIEEHNRKWKTHYNSGVIHDREYIRANQEI